MRYLILFLFLFIFLSISKCHQNITVEIADIFCNYSLNDNNVIQELRNSMTLFFNADKSIDDVKAIWDSLLELNSLHKDFRPFLVYQATAVISDYLYKYSVTELNNMITSRVIPSPDKLLLLATWSSTFVDSFEYWKDLYSKIYLEYLINDSIFVTSLYCFLQAKYLILDHVTCKNSTYNMLNIIRSSSIHLFPPSYTIIQRSYIPKMMKYFKQIDQAYPTIQYIIFKSWNSYTGDLTDFKSSYVDPLMLSLYNIVPFDNVSTFKYSHYFDILKRQIRELFMDISSSKTSDLYLSHIHSWAIGLNRNSTMEYSFFQNDTRLDLISWFNENDVISFMMWLCHNAIKTFVENDKNIANNYDMCLDKIYLQLFNIKNRYVARYELATTDLRNVIKTRLAIDPKHPEYISATLQYDRVIKILELRSRASGILDHFFYYITPPSRNSSVHGFEKFLTENATCMIKGYNMSFDQDLNAFIDFTLKNTKDYYASTFLYGICRLLETTIPICLSVPFLNGSMLLPIYFDMMNYESICNDTVSMGCWKNRAKENMNYIKLRPRRNQPLGWDMRYIRAVFEEGFRLDPNSINLEIWNITMSPLSHNDTLLMIQSLSSYYLYIDSSLLPQLNNEIKTCFKSMFEFCEVYALLYQFDQWVKWKSVLKGIPNMISTNIFVDTMNITNSLHALKAIQGIFRDSYPLFEQNFIISKRATTWGLKYHNYSLDSKTIYQHNHRDDPFGLWLLNSSLRGDIINGISGSKSLMLALQNFTKVYDFASHNDIAIDKWITLRNSLIKTYSELFYIPYNSNIYHSEYNQAYANLRDCKRLNESDYDAWINSPTNLAEEHKKDFCIELERISDIFYKHTILLEILENRGIIKACGKISDLSFITDSIENECHNESYLELAQKTKYNTKKLLVAFAEKFSSCIVNMFYSMFVINLSSSGADEKNCIPNSETMDRKILSNLIKFLDEKNLLSTKYWAEFGILVYRKVWIWYHKMIKLYHKHQDEIYWDIKQVQFISNISVGAIDRLRLELCRWKFDRFENCFTKFEGKEISEIKDMAMEITKHNEIIQLEALQDIYDLLNDGDIKE